MRHQIRLTFCVALSLFAATVGFSTTARAAQLDSIELPAKDPTATAKWYASNFDGKRKRSSVKFGSLTLTWKKAEQGEATTNPAIAHLGFAVDNTAQKLAELAKSKVKVLKDAHSGPASTWAIVEDPNGMLVGILEVPGVKGFQHVMLNAPLNARRETLRWYEKVVGGEVQNLAGSPLWTGIRTNNAWLLFQDEKTSNEAKAYTNASMTWRVDDVGPAKEIQTARADSEEKIGEGLVVIDPCGLPQRFIEDAKAVSTVQGSGDKVTSAEISVTEEHYKKIAEYKGDFTLEVVRVLGQEDCTLGQLFVNNVCLGYVLELPWKGNKPMISSIPAGTYALSLHNDTKKRMRLHVDGVPGRAGVQMHVGTTPEDTQGCILMGTGVSAVNCMLTNTHEAAARLRRAYYGTETPKKLGLDRPAILIVSDSVSAPAAPAR